MQTGPRLPSAALPSGPEEELPVRPRLPEIVEALRASTLLLLTAEPGAGKTSLVPLALAEAFGAAGRVLLVEPRRVAAVSAAARLSELSGLALGEEIGYRVRGESRSGPRARIEAVTAGVLLRMLQADPFLEEVSVLVFDEFHERSLDLDLGFALSREARKARSGGGPGPGPLRVLLMSATLDEAELGRRLDASGLSVAGRTFPVETRYANSAPADPCRWCAEAVLGLLAGGGPGGGGEPARAREAHAREAHAGEAHAVEARAREDLAGRALAARAGGDILVFLPGMGEILRTEGMLREGLRGAEVEILRLHSSLSLAEQRRALKPPPGAPRRVILSSSIAETSLTLPRIGVVVDSGLARLGRYDRRSGLNRLLTLRESADRAEQRRGRAGRLGPGLCLRAWSRAETLPERSPPEILGADLSGLVLECLAWGATEASALEWIDAPPPPAWAEGLETLWRLGALEDPPPAAGASLTAAPPRLSARGRNMAALGAEPRLAALVLAGGEDEAKRRGAGTTACIAAALLDRGGGDQIDFAQRVETLLREAGTRGGERSEVLLLDEARRLASRAGLPFRPETAEPGLLGPLLAAAWPDRIAKRVEEGGASAVFMLPAGRRIRAPFPLAASPWILALDAEAGESLGRLYAGLALEEGTALAGLGPLLEEETLIEWRGRGYRARRLRRAGALELGSRALGSLGRAELGPALLARLRGEGLSALFPDPAAEALLARYRHWRSRQGEAELPELEGPAAVEDLDAWLLPWIEEDREDVLPGRRLRQALEARLGPALLRRLDAEAPESLELPSGSRRPILYGEGPSPVVEARVQEFYGLREQPRAGGEPLVLRLLNPAGRPLQVTADLPGFWKGAWLEARKELRGRYPKHDWPEDPGLASPTRRGLKPRG